MLNVELIRDCKKNSDGWYVLPGGNWVRLGNFVTLGNLVTLGDEVRIGNGVRLGNFVTLGDRVRLGDEVRIGNGVRLGNRVRLGDEVRIGDGVRIGNGVVLGDGITPMWFRGTKHTMNYYAPGLIRSGCIVKPIAWWKENILRCAEENHYTPIESKEYEYYINCIAGWMEMHGLDKVEK